MPKEAPEAMEISVPSLSVRLRGESAMVPSEAVMVVTSPSERESEASCRESVVTS